MVRCGTYGDSIRYSTEHEIPYSIHPAINDEEYRSDVRGRMVFIRNPADIRFCYSGLYCIVAVSTKTG